MRAFFFAPGKSPFNKIKLPYGDIFFPTFVKQQH
jgi:hypothetical protein